MHSIISDTTSAQGILTVDQKKILKVLALEQKKASKEIAAESSQTLKELLDDLAGIVPAIERPDSKSKSDENMKKKPTAKKPKKTPEPKTSGSVFGTPASAGIVSGIVVFDSELAEKMGKEKPVILMKDSTDPTDFYGMNKAAGIVTFDGTLGSHAAIVGRQLKKPTVVGVKNKHLVFVNDSKVLLDNILCRPGDQVEINGDTGEIKINP